MVVQGERQVQYPASRLCSCTGPQATRQTRSTRRCVRQQQAAGSRRTRQRPFRPAGRAQREVGGALRQAKHVREPGQVHVKGDGGGALGLAVVVALEALGPPALGVALGLLAPQVLKDELAAGVPGEHGQPGRRAVGGQRRDLERGGGVGNQHLGDAAHAQAALGVRLLDDLPDLRGRGAGGRGQGQGRWVGGGRASQTVCVWLWTGFCHFQAY